MLKKQSLLLFLVSIIFLQSKVQAQTDSSATIWNLDRLDSIGGCLTTILPNKTSGAASELPIIISTNHGKAAYFNGINDGFLVKGNPLGNAVTWTLEVIFRPDSSSNPNNLEQRFLHIAQNSAASARLLLEIRLLKNQKWALDLYLANGKSNLVLLDTIHDATLHTSNQWHYVAVVYKNPRVTTYIDGAKELSDTVSFQALVNAQTSIGARQDPRSWFKGTIKLIKSTPRVLIPSKFLNVNTLQEVK
ncbi:MAG: LamG-like jellyroll fold domain-containing protein [Bacteroidota bacterium]